MKSKKKPIKKPARAHTKVLKKSALKKPKKKSTQKKHRWFAQASVRYPEGNVLLRNLSRDYPVISRGDGLYLFDTTGKKYLDASGGALVVSIGHGNREVALKIFKQMSRVGYVNGTQFTSSVMERLATKLVARAPKGLNRVALLSSGSEAVEAAVKFVRQLWVERGQTQKSKFIARSPGYHGNTLYALSASARPYYRKFFGPLLSDVVMIPSTYGYRSLVNDYETQGAAYYAGLLEKAIVDAGAENVAGFLVEPVIGSSAGAALPPSGYFKLVQEICRKHNVLIIADEILCGSGRTGKFFASEHFGLEPDVVVMGKGINGGLCPVSCVLVKQEHVDEMKKGSGGFMHAQTYLQSPTMAATALAVLDYFDDHKLVSNCAKVGEYFHKLLKEKIAPLKGVGNVSGLGLLAGVEFVEDKKSKKPFDRSKKMVEGFLAHAFSRGLVLWPNTGHADGVNGDLVMLGPPLTINKSQAAEIVDLLADCIQSFFG